MPAGLSRTKAADTRPTKKPQALSSAESCQSPAWMNPVQGPRTPDVCLRMSASPPSANTDLIFRSEPPTQN
jgi:hypothetical protein